MGAFARGACLLALAACVRGSDASAAGVVTFVVGENNELPMAEIRDGRLVGGILKELGDDIARQLGSAPQYLIVSRKRIAVALAAGEADVACNQRQEWLDVPLAWTAPVIVDRGLLVTRAGAAPIRTLDELAGKRVGMVLGYVYEDPSPDLQAKLIRDDAPTMRANIEKLATGRYDHAFVDELEFRYFQRSARVPIAIHPPYLQPPFEGACGVAPGSKVSAAAVKAAVERLLASGRIEKILGHYR